MNNEIKTDMIIRMLNKRVRECLGQTSAEQIRYSVAGWAEYFATEQFDTTVEALDPQLAALLYDIKVKSKEMGGGILRVATDYGLLLPLDPWKLKGDE